MNGAELIFRHCLPHSLLTLIVLFILRRTHHQSSRTAYGICIILLLGLLIPVKIQLPVSSKIVEPVRSLPLSEVWIESQTPVASAMSTASGSNPSEPGMNGTQIVTLLWLGGCAVALGINLIRNRESLKYIRRWSRLAGSAELESLRQLQSQMKLKRHIRLMMCRGIATPCALGLLHPTLILPEQDWEKEELTLVLTHELIHIRRYDSWIRLLSVIARVVYWFNPIVYLLEIQMNQYCEQACDETVIENCTPEQRQRYGSLLLRQAGSSHSLPILSTGFMLKPKQLQERLMRVMNQKQFKMNWEKVLIVAALVMVAGCVMKEKEIRNFLATPLASHEPVNGKVYASSLDFSALREQALSKERVLVDTYREEHKNDSIQQYNEGMNQLMESIKSKGFALQGMNSYPRPMTLMELPYEITLDVPYLSLKESNYLINVVYTQDGDNQCVSLKDEEQCYETVKNQITNELNQLTEDQISQILGRQKNTDFHVFLEEELNQTAQKYGLTISQFALLSIEEAIDDLPEEVVQLDVTWEELQKLGIDEIRKLADMRTGREYIVVTTDNVRVYNLNIVNLPISSICENKEEGILAQAYIAFGDEASIRQLISIPDLQTRVDQALNERLNNLQDSDHETLRYNLLDAILNELKLTKAPIIVEVAKAY
ncbi:M56 family metallopeptidase [Holdemania filiformis]|uniref:M56 family metallopeptidase n=1 Tax=Holdemania filiformis TaxID=61171 RepID=UPI00267702CC|nr:M56 family metallopeptidase [Holdemania filiformis]